MGTSQHALQRKVGPRGGQRRIHLPVPGTRHRPEHSKLQRGARDCEANRRGIVGRRQHRPSIIRACRAGLKPCSRAHIKRALRQIEHHQFAGEPCSPNVTRIVHPRDRGSRDIDRGAPKHHVANRNPDGPAHLQFRAAHAQPNPRCRQRVARACRVLLPLSPIQLHPRRGPVDLQHHARANHLHLVHALKLRTPHRTLHPNVATARANDGIRPPGRCPLRRR